MQVICKAGGFAKLIIAPSGDKVKKYIVFYKIILYNISGGRVNMNELLKSFFEKQNIEYFSVLDYSHVRESTPEIMQREDFTPRSVIVYLLPYYTTQTVNISRYAASLDYHMAIRNVNDGLILLLSEQFSGSHSKGYGDHSPIDERDAALKAGLGALGRNGLILNEKYGSYVFIGDLVTDISPEKLGAITPSEYKYCPDCGSCVSACPTGVLSGKSYECLSAITQKKGELSDSEISLMREHNTVWGCDLCQSSCPYNQNPTVTPIEFFHRDNITHLTRELLDSMDKQTFKQRAFAWRGRKTVERNLELLNSKQM